MDGTPVSDDMVVGVSDNRVRVTQAGNFVDGAAEGTVVNGLGGDDWLRATADMDALTDLTLNGGPGTDAVTGGASWLVDRRRGERPADWQGW